MRTLLLLAVLIVASRFAGVRFPVDVPRVTLRFRAATGPYSESYRHKGVDLAPWPGSFGASIRAPLAGKVTGTTWDTEGGNVIAVSSRAPFPFTAGRYSDGAVVSVPAGAPLRWRFAHCRDVLVDEGDEIVAGDELGTIGSTGTWSKGPHVHVELFATVGGVEVLLDPMHFFVASIVGLRSKLVGDVGYLRGAA